MFVHGIPRICLYLQPTSSTEDGEANLICRLKSGLKLTLSPNQPMASLTQALPYRGKKITTARADLTVRHLAPSIPPPARPEDIRQAATPVRTRYIFDFTGHQHA